MRTLLIKPAVDTRETEKAEIISRIGLSAEADVNGPKDNIENHDLITKGLFVLNEKQREVFVLFYKLEYTSSEISKMLQIPEGTVKSRLFSGRDLFRNFIKENGASHE